MIRLSDVFSFTSGMNTSVSLRSNNRMDVSPFCFLTPFIRNLKSVSQCISSYMKARKGAPPMLLGTSLPFLLAAQTIEFFSSLSAFLTTIVFLVGCIRISTFWISPSFLIDRDEKLIVFDEKVTDAALEAGNSCDRATLYPRRSRSPSFTSISDSSLGSKGMSSL